MPKQEKIKKAPAIDIKATLKGGEIKAPDTSQAAIKALDASAEAAALVEKLRNATDEDDIVCWCGDPRCCDNLRRPFQYKKSGKPAPVPKRCQGGCC